MKLIVVMLVSVSVLASVSKTFEKDAFSGNKFFYLDQIDRIEILKDLYRQTKAEYALWEIKKKRIGVDGDILFSKAIEEEKTIIDAKDSFDQAKGNLEFIDRVKKLIAGFKDTHFGINANVSASWVVSGFNTNLVKDKVLITGKYEKLLAKILLESENAENIKKIEIGDELLSVDGQPALEVAKSYEDYIDGSSPGFRAQQAAKMLLERTFLFPSKPYVDIVVKKSTDKKIKVRLPYFYSDNNKRKDAKFFFEQVGIKSLKDIRFKYDPVQRKWIADRSLGFKGYEGTSLPKKAIALKDFKSAKEGGASIVRLALILKEAKAYGYLQVNSFSVDTLYIEGKTTTFEQAIKDSVEYLNEQGLDLILDIRHNGGGRGGYPAKLLSALARKDESYKETTWAKRVTRYMRQFLDFYHTDELYQDISDDAFWSLLSDEFYTAVADRELHTPAISKADIKAQEGKEYNGKIVALISPSCISACDIMSMLLKSSKRATLIGTTANGTGAGYYSNTNFNTQFQDLYKTFSTRIPNTLFGYPGDKNGLNAFGANSAYELNSENVPVKADIEYHQTKDDYVKGHVDIIKKAIEVLNSK